MNTETNRNSAIMRFDEWLRTNDGQKCSAGMAAERYLQNRLEMAFKAGWEARNFTGDHPRPDADGAM